MTLTPITQNISVDQLCIGLYVHLDVAWLKHSFARNSFKINNNAQIATIKKLGIKNIRIEMARCDSRPLSLPVTPVPLSDMKLELAQPSAEEVAMIVAKKARIDQLVQKREAINQCEKQYLKAATTFKNISSKLYSQPKEAHHDADELIQQMLASLMSDKDVAIHVMNDKIAGEDTYYHSLNVSVLSMVLAKELLLPPEDIETLGIGCLFHDIGKMDIPDRILHKTIPLNRAEQNLLEMHCQYGESVATKIKLPVAATQIIMQHHEYADGSGYPKQLSLAQISPLARIATIINTYDNYCNRPNPAESLTPYEALSHMFSHQGKLFDPEPLTVFIRCMGVYPPGTLVKLSDGTFGMVISVTPGKTLSPSVLIYDPSVPKTEAIILDLSEEPGLKINASLKIRQLPSDVYEYLSPRKRMNYYFDSPKNSIRKS
jgi:putative nucleotidyltransferase with HDIG domain